MFERVEETQWIWKDDRMIKTPITYVPFFYDIFDRILVNAADRKQRVKEIEVKINAADNLISIWSDGESVPDVGPYHSYFSEYKIESTNGHHRIKKVKEFNQKEKTIIHRTSTKSHISWNMVSFKPDLAQFGMERLDDNIVALMKTRVVDLAGCSCSVLKVLLDGTPLLFETFQHYVSLYIQTFTHATITYYERIYGKIFGKPNDRWDICVARADGGHFDEVSFVNYIATMKGGAGKLNIPKLQDAKLADTPYSQHCTLILTQGYSSKAFARSRLSVMGQDKYGVFPLKGELLNVREASPKQLEENTEIQNIKKILGLEDGKIYENVKELRYGHLMIMADEDHDGLRMKGLLINFLHYFWPSLLKVKNFMQWFIAPIVKASHKKTNKVFLFYSMLEYEAWKEKLGNEYNISYYQGQETIQSEEKGEYYFDQHVKDFVWENDEDGDAIELAFSTMKIDDREQWLQAPQVWLLST
ncbi:DNA topoisomerase 2 [Tanacetum coccineum]|uniref:DNA topoisomerase (ATP-hydrolyzing) n=1 Tax=Tanacetum coccineum TaxID=301880 RepID=A0ABQ4XFY4_9ASTR